MGWNYRTSGLELIFFNWKSVFFFFFLIKRKQFLNIYSAGIKKMWAVPTSVTTHSRVNVKQLNCVWHSKALCPVWFNFIPVLMHFNIYLFSDLFQFFFNSPFLVVHLHIQFPKFSKTGVDHNSSPPPPGKRVKFGAYGGERGG